MRWLLIFDNLEDAQLLEPYVPENMEGGFIIITTQHAHVSPVTDTFKRLELNPLSGNGASDLFFRILERDPVSEGERVTVVDMCDWVGRLPLAIVTVAGYTRRSSHSPSEIFGRLQHSSKVWEDSHGSGKTQHYDKTLATAFDLALSQISDDSRHLLHILAFLSPHGIPEALLKQKHRDYLRFLHFLNDQDR